MNNSYVLITLNEDKFSIKGLGTDLERLDRKKSRLINKGWNVCGIYNIADIANDKLYFDDSIDAYCKSFVKYKFYPILRSEVKIKDVLTAVSYDIKPSKEMTDKSNVAKLFLGMISHNPSLRSVIKSIKPSDMNVKVRYIGYDSWIKAHGVYMSVYDSSKPKSYYFKSLYDYIQRHKGLSNNSYEIMKQWESCDDVNDFMINSELKSLSLSDIENSFKERFEILDKDLIVFKLVNEESSYNIEGEDDDED